jgi:nucleotide-binding universal stress UspA family protein
MLMAKRLRQPVVLITVVGADELVAHQGHPASLRWLETQQNFGYEYLDKLRPRFAEAGVQVSIESLIGPVARTILDAAAVHDAGFIAMATHGRSGCRRVRLGSVSDRVVRTSPLPVLLVRQPHPQRPWSSEETAIREVLLPLDGSALSEAAVPVAAYVAKAFQVPVTVTRAVPYTPYMWGALPYEVSDAVALAELMTALEETAKGYVEQTCEKLRSGSVECRAQVVRANPGPAIAERMVSHPGTLVVMSSHGRTGMERAVMGSVTDYVVRNVAGPVLVVARVPDKTLAQVHGGAPEATTAGVKWRERR